MLLLIEINQATYEAIQLNQYLGCKTMLESIVANGKPIKEGDCISREALKKAIEKSEPCCNAWVDIIDNAPSLGGNNG